MLYVFHFIYVQMCQDVSLGVKMFAETPLYNLNFSHPRQSTKAQTKRLFVTSFPATTM